MLAKEIVRASRESFFWIPSALVAIDLAFFISVPALLLYITRSKDEALSARAK